MAAYRLRDMETYRKLWSVKMRPEDCIRLGYPIELPRLRYCKKFLYAWLTMHSGIVYKHYNLARLRAKKLRRTLLVRPA